MFMRPDPLLTQCHDIVYGINNAVDFSLTAVIQPAGCILANAGCAIIPGGGVGGAFTIPASVTLASTRVDYTLFNNRDPFTGSFTIGYYLSTDALVDASDVRIRLETAPSTTWAQGLVQRRNSGTIYFNPQTAMPIVGANYRVLIRVDESALVSESRESNNVTDTNYFLRRIP